MDSSVDLAQLRVLDCVFPGPSIPFNAELPQEIDKLRPFVLIKLRPLRIWKPITDDEADRDRVCRKIGVIPDRLPNISLGYQRYKIKRDLFHRISFRLRHKRNYAAVFTRVKFPG